MGIAGLLWFAVWVKQNRGARMDARPTGPGAGMPAEETSAEYVPPFKASTFEGKPFSIASYEGKQAVVIDFWASWCDLCKIDMPRVQEAAAVYGQDKVVVAGIHRGDTESALSGMDLAVKLGITYVLVQDPDGRLFKLIGQGKPFMPLTIFIDKEGRILDRRFGPKTEEEIRVSMAKIVAP